MFGQKFLILPNTLGIVGLLEPLDKVGVEGVVEAHVVVARQHVALRGGPGVKHRAKPSVKTEFWDSVRVCRYKVSQKTSIFLSVHAHFIIITDYLMNHFQLRERELSKI